MIKHLLEQRCLPRLYTEESWKGGSLWNETCKSCFIYYLKSSNLAYSRKVTEFKMCVCVCWTWWFSMVHHCSVHSVKRLASLVAGWRWKGWDWQACRVSRLTAWGGAACWCLKVARAVEVKGRRLWRTPEKWHHSPTCLPPGHAGQVGGGLVWFGACPVAGRRWLWQAHNTTTKYAPN